MSDLALGEKTHITMQYLTFHCCLTKNKKARKLWSQHLVPSSSVGPTSRSGEVNYWLLSLEVLYWFTVIALPALLTLFTNLLTLSFSPCYITPSTITEVWQLHLWIPFSRLLTSWEQWPEVQMWAAKPSWLLRWYCAKLIITGISHLRYFRYFLYLWEIRFVFLFVALHLWHC